MKTFFLIYFFTFSSADPSIDDVIYTAEQQAFFRGTHKPVRTMEDCETVRVKTLARMRESIVEGRDGLTNIDIRCEQGPDSRKHR